MATINTYCKNEKQISDHQLFTNFWMIFFAFLCTYLNMDFFKKSHLGNIQLWPLFYSLFFQTSRSELHTLRSSNCCLIFFSWFNVYHFQMTIFCQSKFCQNRKKALSVKVELFCKVYIKSSHVKTLNQSFLRPYCKEIKKV